MSTPKGRAENVMLVAKYQVNRKETLEVCYRIPVGGAENDEV